MNFVKKVPAVTAAAALTALFLALPASAQTASNAQVASNAAPHPAMGMAKAAAAPAARPSSETLTLGTAAGTDRMAKVTNGLK